MIRTEEFANPSYVQNGTDRCYFCKSELYGRLSGLLGELGVDVIASGANTDDSGDHRPGMRAAAENAVRHPLQECRLGKADVRAWPRGGICPPGTSRRPLACRAGSPMASRSLPNGCG